ncbi:alpha/beta fold hydrolase [uncultured Cyclobacterium sp.]|uniref:alpha/beta hydrolase n=1 Tax=uncultured Cyclobacterium sp. TaxID=453820 RepID=UPI0030EE991C|tara:strand:+ start:22794 stop:24203 length:1410 start_codon:yes stop_codon:yes gene_type:complete
MEQHLDKKSSLLCLIAVLFFTAASIGYSQTIEGTWEGELDLGLQKLPLVFNFETATDGWKGSLDSPQQNAFGIPLTSILFDGTLISLQIASLGADFEGTLINNTLVGQFKQSGLSLSLTLTPSKIKEAKLEKRPQTPVGPFPYEIINTSFVQKKENLLFKGTVTKPRGEGPFPSVVLISGSGPQDRNSEIFGHYPFWVIADHLTRQGIVVLRYDDRGVAESEGTMEGATTMDFTKDAWAAVEKLQSFSFVDKAKVGVIGHSEGGLIAWMMGAENSGNLSFISALAPPVISIDSLMGEQTYDLVKASGAAEELARAQEAYNFKLYQRIKTSQNVEEAHKNLKAFLESDPEWMGLDSLQKATQVDKRLKQFAALTAPWFYQFIKTEPREYISRIIVPTWVAFGGKDKQVNASSNKKSLLHMGMENMEVKVYDKLNHLFQTAETGAVSEYSNLSETFNPSVLDDMATWINSQ